jgi:hypothetical protein
MVMIASCESDFANFNETQRDVSRHLLGGGGKRCPSRTRIGHTSRTSRSCFALVMQGFEALEAAVGLGQAALFMFPDRYRVTPRFVSGFDLFDAMGL